MNPMMPGQTPAPGNQMMPQQGASPPMGGPQPASPPAPPAAVTPEMVADARHQSKTLINGLLSLLNKPRGQLTKKDVFAEAADLISKGVFPTPQDKQALIAELAKLPDDNEKALRDAIGETLFHAAQHRSQIHAAHGPDEAEPPPMMPGPPNV